jgi:hypothetical protein
MGLFLVILLVLGFLWCGGELHCLLADHVAIFRIEEKGEGFENGKNRFWPIVVCLQP